MKIGIVGCGNVGAAAAYACILKGIGNELVLVDQDEKLASAQTEDLSHAVPFTTAMSVTCGNYNSLVNCGLIMISAGVSQKPGETRLDLLERNAEIFESIIPKILNASPNAILLIATNPVDIMTHIAASIAKQGGHEKGKVIGTGTILDTARFRTLLAQHLNASTHSIHANVLGEHGDSEILNWSNACIGNVSIYDFANQTGLSITPADITCIDNAVRNAGYRIQKGKGETSYGVAAGITRIASAIIDNERAVLVCCAPLNEVEGIKDVTLSLPHIISRYGIEAPLYPKLDDSEREGLRNSAHILKASMSSVGY